MTTENSTTASFEQFVRPQTKLSLVFELDLLNSVIDMRNSNVLQLTENSVIISQTDPPILRSYIGRSLEITFVRRDPVTGNMARWGWFSEIEELISDYKVREDDTETTQVVSLTRPPDAVLKEANIRLDYRLSVGALTKISTQTHPSFGRINLLDFSAGGALIAVPAPPQAQVGMRLWFTLIFPPQLELGPQSNLNGEAEVVRVAYAEGDPAAKVGLKFCNLDLSAVRALQKAVNYYMLQEQRHRSRF